MENKEKSILFQEGGVVRQNKNLEIVYNNGYIISFDNLEELGKHLKEKIDFYIDHLKEDSKNHKVSKGIIIYPLIHIVYDDLLSDKEKLTMDQIYNKKLN